MSIMSHALLDFPNFFKILCVENLDGSCCDDKEQMLK